MKDRTRATEELAGICDNACRILRSLVVFAVGAAVLAGVSGCSSSGTEIVGAANSAKRVQSEPDETIRIRIGDSSLAPGQPIPPLAQPRRDPRDPRNTAPYWSPDEDGHSGGGIAGRPVDRVIRVGDVAIPAGTSQDVQIDIERRGGRVDASNTSSAGSITTDDPKAAADFEGSAAAVGEPAGLNSGRKPGRGIGGGASSAISLTSITDSVGVAPLYVIGALVMVAAGALAWWRKNITIGVVGAGLGLAIIAAAVVAETAPWVFAVVLIAALAVVGWLVFDAARNRGARDRAEAGTIAMQAISEADTGAGSAGDVIKSLINTWVPKDHKYRKALDREVEMTEAGRGIVPPI